MPKQIKEKRIEQSEPSCWSKFQKGKKMNFHVEPISGMNFHVRPDLQNEKKWKKTKKMKKNELFRFFSFFFILKVLFFLVPKKSSFWNFAHVKSSFFFIPEKCSKQKFVFCLSPCFKISSSNTLSQTRPKPLEFRV